MKKSIKPFVLFSLAISSLGLAVLTSGCASTDTRASTGEYIDDSSITMKVKAAILKDPAVGVMDVSVATFKGVVQLSGFVDTATEKERAEVLAAGVSGVVRVENNLLVK